MCSLVMVKLVQGEATLCQAQRGYGSLEGELRALTAALSARVKGVVSLYAGRCLVGCVVVAQHC